jgi:hypothetical protein
MAEQSKFAGALARLKQPAAGLTTAAPAGKERPPAPIQAVVPAGGGKGRPATGKRSDPEWNRYTVLLRRETHKRTSRRLQDLDTGQDLSELMDQLLTAWLER